MGNPTDETRLFREGWAVMDGHIAEYGHVRYLQLGHWWIGLSIRWCETLDGQVLPSKFRHATNSCKHWRVLWYVHITSSRIPAAKWRVRYVGRVS